MKKSWLKTIGRSAALMGTWWALLPSSGRSPHFMYDETLSSRDSVYATRMAEAIYSYKVYADKQDPLFKAVPEDSLASWSEQSVNVNYNRSGFFFFGTKSHKLEDLVATAREEKKRFVMLSERFSDNDFIADTSDLNALMAYSKTGMEENNDTPVPVYIEFSNERNAHALEGTPFSKGGIFLNVSLLTDYEKPVIYAVTDHEGGHHHLFQREEEVWPTDLKGHEKTISMKTQRRMAIENFCDYEAARKKDFDQQSLVGMCTFLTDHYVSPSGWDRYRKMQKEDAIASLAVEIFIINKNEIRYASSHPPSLYRFLNMATTANIDITTLKRDFEKNTIISVEYAPGHEPR